MKTPCLRTYVEARDWLYSLKNRGATYGIERMEVFARELGNPQFDFPVIHIAGTNGKGSTAAMLEAIFRKHGYKTGLSSSPHLVRQGERIQINRRITSEQRILELANELKLVAEKIAERDPELHPSFFEFMTAMAFLEFSKAKVDIAIVEVGLGGRLDASNVVDPEVSVITSIALDHCEILGDTLGKIAIEKAGIIKPGKPVVMGWLPEEAENEIRSIALERNSALHRAADAFGENGQDCPQTSLQSGYQRLNAGIAMSVVSVLKGRFELSETRAQEALLEVKWPGRWEETRMRRRKVVFDVSHNAEGAHWLEQNLRDLSEAEGKPDIVMGVMGKYRAEALVPVAAKYAQSLTFVVPAQSRSCSFEELEASVPNDFAGEVKRSSVADIFPASGICSLDFADSAPLVVTGSIYLIGEIWERFREPAPVGQSVLQDF